MDVVIVLMQAEGFRNIVDMRTPWMMSQGYYLSFCLSEPRRNEIGRRLFH